MNYWEKNVRSILLLIVLLVQSLVVISQVTTSAMNGRVSDCENALPGATVVVTHEPSGTKYAVITNNKGYFVIQGMRTGGPYRVEISYVGYQKAIYREIYLSLSEPCQLNVELKSATELEEVVVMAVSHGGEKTGPVTHIKENQWLNFPNISRSLKDMVALSPYAQGVRLGGRDQRQNNVTVDGANFNFNMGLDGEILSAGGTPISIDALEEIQVSIAPFDVRQSHFVGGSINAVTKSGTNVFRGNAYTYWHTEHLRGNRIDGEELGERPLDRRNVYGLSLGGPVLKNKLFFFVNGEYEHTPAPIYKWRTSTDGKADEQNFISRLTVKDMQDFSDILMRRYNYNPGSYTDFDGVKDTYRLMARLDWNMNDRHKLMVRYNYSSQRKDNPLVGAVQGVTGGPMGQYSMTFRGSCWTNTNSISSWTAELNSRISLQVTNQLLGSYTVNHANKRKGNSREFPTIDILKEDEAGNRRAFMNAGYDQHAWRNGIDEKTWSITDNLTYIAGSHHLIAGLSYESTIASNCYMRYGAGYYRYNSFEDFVQEVAPSAFAICYSLTGNERALSEVHYDELSLYLQDDWTVNKHWKLYYGLRMDLPLYLNSRYANPAIENYNFNGTVISTSHWPKSQPLLAPRGGFIYDVFADGSLKIRGGTGIFNGRFPLIFLSKMQEASGMLQYSYLPNTSVKDPEVLAALTGGIRERDEVIALLKAKFPDKFPDMQEPSVSNIATIDRDFKMPQVWKTALAVDYVLPVCFPAYLTLEATYTKDVNAINYRNVNIRPTEEMGRFSGPDPRFRYPSDKFIHKEVNNAIVMENTHRGYSYTLNATLNAEPIPRMDVMLAYTYTESKVLSNSKSNQVDNAWSQEPSVNGPNYQLLHTSAYMQSPHRLIGQVSYNFNWLYHLGTQVSLFYEGMRAGCYSYMYSNDMNNDGVNFDLIYVPATPEELNFKDYTLNAGEQNEVTFTAVQQQEAFWNYVNQDPYLKKRKGKYAEAYAANLPWVHHFNLRIVQDIHVSLGKTENKLQISLDILNIGNLFNSSWGVNKMSWGSGKLLSYQGINSDNEPIYTFSTVNDRGVTKLPESSFYKDRSAGQCWTLQLGVRYVFN